MKNFLQVNRALAAENNFYLNLNQLPSKNDGEPTVNRQSRLMLRHGKRSENGALSSTCLRSASVPLSFRSRYLRYAAVIFCVLVLSVGQAWSTDQVLKTVDFSTSAWSSATFTADATTVVDGVTASSGSSSSKLSFPKFSRQFLTYFPKFLDTFPNLVDIFLNLLTCS